MSREESIRETVLSAAGRNVDTPDKGCRQLVRYLTANDTRNTAYQCCVESLDLSHRGLAAGKLLMNYIPSFPPSRAMLLTIRKRCATFTRSSSLYAGLYKSLDALARSLLTKPFEDQLKGPPPQPKVSSRKTHKYVTTFHLQPPVSEQSAFIHVSPDLPAITLNSTTDETCIEVMSPLSTMCRDYVDQWPLVCGDDVIEQQLGVLSHFWDKYRSNPAVVNASIFLIKQMCDGYVAKLAFGPPYHRFRSVTMCYLPTLFEWMRSDYLCVQMHVYDFLLTLSMHLQIVDGNGTFPGCTETLQQEVAWLLLHVLERQATQKPYDTMTWTAAAKCTLAVIPPGYHFLVDSRALVQFMQLPGLAEQHPRAFTLFAEAFEFCLLHFDAEGVATTGSWELIDAPFASILVNVDGTPVLNAGQLRKLGSGAIAAVLALYRRSSSAGARLSFFKVLFVHAVARLAAKTTSEEITGPKVLRCFDALVSLGFYWHLHLLLFYEARNVRHNISKQIIADFSIPDANDVGPLATRIIQTILQIVAEDMDIPTEIMESFMPAKEPTHTASGPCGSGSGTPAAAASAAGEAGRHDPCGRGEAAPPCAAATSVGGGIRRTGSPSRDTGTTISDRIYDAMTAVPMILRETATDPKTYNVAWRLSFLCFRSSKQPHVVPSQYANRMTDYLADQLVNYSGTADERERAFISRVCPDLVMSFTVLVRTQARQAVDGLGELLERFLFAPNAPLTTAQAMTLSTRFLQCLAVSDERVTAPSADEDITHLLTRGALRIQHATARSLGARVLWALYRALVSEQATAVRRTRYVLVSILAGLMEEAKCSPWVVCAWNSISFDPCLRIAEFAKRKRSALPAAEGRKGAA